MFHRLTGIMSSLVSTLTYKPPLPTAALLSNPPYKPFKVGLLQLNTQSDLDANFDQCRRLLERAVQLGAQVIITPENTARLTALTAPTTPFTAATHPLLPRFCQLAKQHAVTLVIGSMPVLPVDGATKTVNRSFFIGRDGRVVAEYDKVHLFDVPTLNGAETYTESAKVQAGDAFRVVHTPYGPFGLSVCYDLRFPAVYRSLAHCGAYYLTVPSAFTVMTGRAHWRILLQARAIETGSYVFAPAQCGSHSDGARRTYGHSLIVSPWGEVLAEGTGGDDGESGCGGNGEGCDVLLCDIDPARVEECRKRIPSLTHDRAFTVAQTVDDSPQSAL